MPGRRFTKLANTPKRERLWKKIYTSEKSRIGKVRAIRAANSVLRKRFGK